MGFIKTGRYLDHGHLLCPLFLRKNKFELGEVKTSWHSPRLNVEVVCCSCVLEIMNGSCKNHG